MFFQSTVKKAICRSYKVVVVAPLLNKYQVKGKFTLKYIILHQLQFFYSNKLLEFKYSQLSLFSGQKTIDHRDKDLLTDAKFKFKFKFKIPAANVKERLKTG